MSGPWLGCPAEAVGLSTHAAVLGRRLVIPAEEVEEAVREEHRDLVEDACPTFVSLFPRGRNAHNDVAQSLACELRKVAFTHRESEDVRWAIFMAIDFVQLMDAFVVS